MKKIEILGDNRHETYTKIREGSRAVIERDGKLLLTYEKVSGWWLLPGGGLEVGETPAMCCVREVEEETGYIVRPLRKFLVINEYYEEYRYVSRYFSGTEGEANWEDFVGIHRSAHDAAVAASGFSTKRRARSTGVARPASIGESTSM